MNKLKIVRTIIEESCLLGLVDDYADCFEVDTINIDVLANDGTLTSPTVTIGTPPTKGVTTVELDGTITYEATTAEAGDTDFFTYIVTDGECSDSATVFIIIDSALEPLPNYTEITLNKNTGGGIGCAISGANQVTKYHDLSSFASATNLCNDIHGIYKAPVGYYTNGTINRYWSGTSFGATTSC